MLQDHPVVLVVPGQRPGGRVALLALLGAHLDAVEGRARRSADGPGGGRGGARWGSASGWEREVTLYFITAAALQRAGMTRSRESRINNFTRIPREMLFSSSPSHLKI